jgi:membrane protein DedA with SNARE-associated domain
VLLVGAAAASWLGEVLGYHVFRRIRAGLARRRPRLVRGLVSGTVATLETLLERTISDHPYRTAMVARFLPAGRTALAWAAAGTSKPPYARMAALGGALWAVYTVSLGLVIAWIAGPGLQSLVGSVVTIGAVGLVLGWIARRRQRTHPDQVAPAALAIAAEPSEAFATTAEGLRPAPAPAAVGPQTAAPEPPGQAP